MARSEVIHTYSFDIQNYGKMDLILSTVTVGGVLTYRIEIAGVKLWLLRGIDVPASNYVLDLWPVESDRTHTFASDIVNVIKGQLPCIDFSTQSSKRWSLFSNSLHEQITATRARIMRVHNERVLRNLEKKD